jgi:hypothetical protein
MSIEYLGIPVPKLDKSKIDDLIARLAQADGFSPLRKTGSGLGLVSTTAIENTLETATITIAPNEIYVGFHVATRKDRDYLIGIIQQFLLENSVECKLEEQ